MTAKSKFRGHDIYQKNGKWFYLDGDIVENRKSCGHCGKHDTEEGHDGCLGTLPGVMNACCGHGQANEAYVQFWDGICIRGHSAIIIATELKNSKPDFTVKIGV